MPDLNIVGIDWHTDEVEVLVFNSSLSLKGSDYGHNFQLSIFKRLCEIGKLHGSYPINFLQCDSLHKQENQISDVFKKENSDIRYIIHTSCLYSDIDYTGLYCKLDSFL